MNITPEKFARLLYDSTLSDDEKEAILRLLPSLDSNQIISLALALQKDLDAQHDAIKAAERKTDQIILKMNVELDQIDLKPNIPS